MKRAIIPFVVSGLTAYLLMSIVGTQLVLADVLSFGLVVSLSDRLAATVHDISGLFPALPILVFASLLAAFLVAAVAIRFLGGNRKFWYAAAGLLAMPVALLLIKSAMGGTLFAAARTTGGMMLIAVCGMFSGWLFARLTANRRTQ